MAATTESGISVVNPMLDEKPWGGRKLANYGFVLPIQGLVGEALVTDNEARIASGIGQGRTLGDVIGDDPDAMLGAVSCAAVGGRRVFPLLVKLIDASQNLSIQVHPDDSQAAERDRLGKTEAWHVLAADPGSHLYVGLQDGVSQATFLQAAARLDGSSAALLRRIPAQVGTTILLPAGAVHALGAGVMVYEIQQPSDLTYRLDDWGRIDVHGNPREMHLESGTKALRPELRPDLIPPVVLPASEGRRHLLVACAKFALERIALPAGGQYRAMPSNGPQVITVIGGAARLGDESLMVGQSAVIWPGSTHVKLEAATPCVVLRGWVPDLAAELEEIATLAGVELSALELIAGPLPDVREALDVTGRKSD